RACAAVNAARVMLTAAPSARWKRRAMSRDRALMPGATSEGGIVHIWATDRTGCGCAAVVSSVCSSDVHKHIDAPMSTQSAHANRRRALAGSMTGLITIPLEAAFVRSRYTA